MLRGFSKLNFILTARNCGGHISGIKSKPTDEDQIERWKTNEAQIMSWILGSVDPQFLYAPQTLQNDYGKCRTF